MWLKQGCSECCLQPGEEFVPECKSRKLCYHNKEKTKPELSSVLSDVIASLMAHILFLVLQKYIQNIEEVEFKIL